MYRLRTSGCGVLGLLVLSCVLNGSIAKREDTKNAETLSAAKLSKYIKCDACMAMGEALYEVASKVITEKGGRKKMGEEPILEVLEGICDEGSANGEWINKIDIVGEKGALKLQRKSDPGKCGTECKAVVKVCEDVRTTAGESDIAEKLYRGHYTSSKKDFSSAVCNKMTRVCKKPAPELKARRVDEEFRPFASKEWEARKVQNSMKDLGMKGQMYDRESLKDMLAEESGSVDTEPDQSRETRSEEQRKWERNAYWWEKMINGWLRRAGDVLLSALHAAQGVMERVTDVVVGWVRQVVAAVSGKPKQPEL